MQVTLNKNVLYPNFTAKKKQTRIADDIQRKSKSAFPIISATYAKKYYGVLDSADLRKKERAKDIVDELTCKIATNRMQCDDGCGDIYYTPGGITEVWLDKIKKDKIGNCFESSLATFATLIANGYYNSDMAKVNIDVQFVDKDTGKVIYSDFVPLDHSIAVSDMEKGFNPKNEKKYILDSWSGFASEKSEANRHFSAIADKDRIENAIKLIKAQMENAYSGLSSVNVDNCYPRVGFFITEDGMSFNYKSLFATSEHFRKKYPEMRLKND